MVRRTQRRLTPRGRLDPKNDLVFKLLLTHPLSRGVLAYVISGVLGPDVGFDDFAVIDARLPGTDLDDKAIAFDVRVRLVDGREVDLELQCLPTWAFRERLVYYGARSLSAQLEPGDPYTRLRPSIVVAFLAYREFAEPGFHKTFILRDSGHHVTLTDVLVVHTIELPKLVPLDTVGDGRHDPLVVFSRFLAARSDAEFAALAAEHPAMKQAVQILDKLSSDADVRRLAADREARLRLDAALRIDELDTARAKARAEGREEGRVEGEAKGRVEGEAKGRVEGEAKGRVEGEAKGRVEGEAKGRVEVLLRILVARFGPVTEDIEGRVRAADTAHVDRWIDRALVGGEVGEVFVE